MPPPDLSRDAPIPYILHPLKIGLLPDLRNDSSPVISNCLNSRFGQRLRFDKPLERKVGFDNGLTTITMTHHVTVVLDFDQYAVSLKIFNDLVSTFKTICPLIRARVLIHSTRFINHLDLFQTMIQSNFKIIEIVSRSDLQTARPELDIHIRIGNNRNLPIDNRKDDLLPNHRPIAFILRIHGHSRISEHGLRPGGRHDNETIPFLEGIFEMIEFP